MLYGLIHWGELEFSILRENVKQSVDRYSEHKLGNLVNVTNPWIKFTRKLHQWSWWEGIVTNYIFVELKELSPIFMYKYPLVDATMYVQKNENNILFILFLCQTLVMPDFHHGIKAEVLNSNFVFVIHFPFQLIISYIRHLLLREEFELKCERNVRILIE